MNIDLTNGRGYFNNIPSEVQYDYLNSDTETDVVIIGGGITGSLCAYYLAKNNIPCVLIEKSRISYDSTSIATSLLQYELDDNIFNLQNVIPIEKIEKIYKLSISALNEIDQIITEYGNNCCYAKRDCFLYTDLESKASEIVYEFEKRKQMELDVELFSKAKNPFEFDVAAGVYAKDGGAVLNPYQFTHMLLNIASQKNARIFENTEALEIITDKENETSVITKYNFKIKCKKVIVATGFETERFLKKEFGKKSVTFNIVTKPIEYFEGWYSQALIRDNLDIYHYLRITEDNRIIIGGEDVNINRFFTSPAANEKKYKTLLNHLKKMFPSIKKQLEIDYSYCGTFAQTKDNVGFIGEDKKNPNIWCCLGYGANGIIFSTIGAKLLAEKYLGTENEDLEIFSTTRKI